MYYLKHSQAAAEGYHVQKNNVGIGLAFVCPVLPVHTAISTPSSCDLGTSLPTSFHRIGKGFL